MIYRNLLLSKSDIENIYNRMNHDRLSLVSLKGSKLGSDNYQDIYFLKENDEDIRYMDEKHELCRENEELSFIIDIDMIKDLFELLVLYGRKNVFISYKVEEEIFPIIDYFMNVSFTYPIVEGNCFEAS